MSTSGSFTPPGEAPCPAPMTLAALLALKNSGQLRVGCHYVVTDGPVIGTAGNTSPTQIELHAVSASELSMEASVHTTFGPTAWVGIFDPELGPNGSIQRLTDVWNNTAQDSDLNAPTVHTQVPWHKGSNTFRDNFFDDCTLIGWAAAGGDIRDNVLQEVAVDITGKTAGTFSRNTIVGGSFTALTATSFIAGNQLSDATVSHTGSGAGSFSMQNNVMLTGNVTVDAATTSQVTFNNNVVGGAAGGYRVLVEAKTGSQAIVTGNRLFNQGLSADDLRMSGTGSHVFSSNEVGGGTINLDSSGDSQMHANTFTDMDLSYTSGTLVQIRRTVMIGSTLVISGTSNVDGGRLLKSSLTTAGFNIDTFDIVGGTKTLTANQSDRVRNALGSNLV